MVNCLSDLIYGSCLVFICLFLLNTSFVSAQCSDEQIDINSASVSDLEKIINIGPVYAQRIVDYREEKKFESLDELIEIKGIGEVRLEQIKQEELACVSGNSDDDKNSESEEENKNQDKQETIKYKENKIDEDSEEENKKETEASKEKIINLNSGGVEGLDESDNSNNEISGKVIYESKNEIIKKYSIYGFCVFLLLIIVILVFWR